MTNKPMLSVELRALLERILSEPASNASYGNLRDRAELRALLDNPEQPPVADLLLASAHSYVKAAGETQNLARHLQSRIEVYFDGEPAARRQGEPVGEVVHVSEDQIRIGLYDEYSLKVGDLVYAEQPAPAAVVKPQFDMQMVMMCLGGIRGAPALTSNQCHALAQMLNACSAEVARLNGVKP